MAEVNAEALQRLQDDAKPTKEQLADPNWSPKKNKKKRGSKQKQRMQNYPIPEGLLQSSETPGFDVKVHKKLRPGDFADILYYLDWETWWHKEHIFQIELKRAEIVALGQTSEERKIQVEIKRLQKRLEELSKKS